LLVTVVLTVVAVIYMNSSPTRDGTVEADVLRGLTIWLLWLLAVAAMIVTAVLFLKREHR
jgi:hypothetical protein